VRMSKRAITTIRRSTEEWMVDEIELWSPSSWSYDETTLKDEHTPGTKEWEGKARISPTQGPREQAVGDDIIVMRDADVLVPIGAPEPYRDQEVLVKASEDPALVGRWFRITDVRVFSQQAARRFSIVQSQKSRDHDPRGYAVPEPEDPEGDDD
jgi:hypothetical protein